MDVLEAQNRIRALFVTLRAQPEGEREPRLRKEFSAILSQTPRAEQPALLEGLSRAFPIWPPDVPPPPAPTDEELIDSLRMRVDMSADAGQHIQKLLRGRELGSGLSAEDVEKIRDLLAIDPGSQPEAGRVVEAFTVLLKTIVDIDQTVRTFLQEYGLGMMAVGTPKLRETLVRLLALPDKNSARHAELTRLDNACALLTRSTALLVHWPTIFAEQVAEQLAPRRIEASVPPTGVFKRVDYEGMWNEYVARLDRKDDEEHYKAKMLEIMRRVIAGTV